MLLEFVEVTPTNTTLPDDARVLEEDLCEHDVDHHRAQKQDAEGLLGVAYANGVVDAIVDALKRAVLEAVGPGAVEPYGAVEQKPESDTAKGEFTAEEGCAQYLVATVEVPHAKGDEGDGSVEGLP